VRFFPLFRLQYYELFLNWQNFFEKTLKKLLTALFLDLDGPLGKLAESLVPSALVSGMNLGSSCARPVDF